MDHEHPVAWSSQDPSVASVGGDGTVTGTSTGTTVVEAVAGAARAEATVRVEPANFLMQWASVATASSNTSLTAGQRRRHRVA